MPAVKYVYTFHKKIYIKILFFNSIIYINIYCIYLNY